MPAPRSALRLAGLAAVAVTSVRAHGAMTHPRTRNSIDWLAGANTQKCSNMTGAPCENGQAAFWYSQGCFIGCPTCDDESGRRQTDLCGLGKKQTLTDPKYWSVNRDAEPFGELDIYRHNPWRAREPPPHPPLQLTTLCSPR